MKMFVQVNFKFSIMLSINLLSSFRVNLNLATIFIYYINFILCGLQLI